MSWRQKYELAMPTGHLVIVGTAAGLAGLLLWPWLGVAALLLPVGFPLAVRYLGARRTIICYPEGFTVITAVGCAGHTTVRFRWQEVIRTEYQADLRGARGAPACSFRAETATGVAFTASERHRQFQDLIEVCNAMTPHLPYVWQPEAGTGRGAPPARHRRYTAVRRL